MLRWFAVPLAVACIVVSLEVTDSAAVASNPSGEFPIKTVTIVLYEGERERLFDLLQRYADRYEFAIRIGPTRPDVPSYLIEMWRSDIKVFGTNPFDRDMFKIRFYQNSTEPVPAEVVDDLADGLERELSDVDGIRVLEVEQGP